MSQETLRVQKIFFFIFLPYIHVQEWPRKLTSTSRTIKEGLTPKQSLNSLGSRHEEWRRYGLDVSLTGHVLETWSSTLPCQGASLRNEEEEEEVTRMDLWYHETTFILARVGFVLSCSLSCCLLLSQIPLKTCASREPLPGTSKVFLDFQWNIFLFFINLIYYGNNIKKGGLTRKAHSFPHQSISTNPRLLIGI